MSEASDVSHDPSGGHDDEAGFHAAVNGGDTTELTFVAEESGTLELFCSAPGCRDLGMVALLVIE